MSQIDSTVNDLYDYLKRNGPQPSRNGWYIAQAIGCEYQDLRAALSLVRSAPFIEEHGWTVPFVGQGGRAGCTYAVVETREAAEVVLKSGQWARGKDILTALRNWDAQADHGLVLLDARTAEGRWNRLASTQIKAMIAMAEALDLEDGA